MKAMRIYKSGWNKYAAIAGPFWYIKRGMYLKGLLLLLVAVASCGLGIIPVWLYCGYHGNADFYTHLKEKHFYIY